MGVLKLLSKPLDKRCMVVVDVDSTESVSNREKPEETWTVVACQRRAAGALCIGRTWQNVPR